MTGLLKLGLKNPIKIKPVVIRINTIGKCRTRGWNLPKNTSKWFSAATLMGTRKIAR
jgi:hypothetical protein|tara:strand:+ start:997 stop:1167 length:171 start_codon:yes stop_codon:yes gene_type:complete